MIQQISLSKANVKVLDCEHKTPVDVGEGHPYIAIPDIQDGIVSLASTRRIVADDYTEWTKRTKPQIGDLVVTRRGRVGDSAPIPIDGCAIGQNLVILRSDGTKVSQEYLRWACRSPQWWTEVAKYKNVGAVFSSLNVSDIGKISIPIPNLLEQKAIAEVLGALDDKIAANRRAVGDGVKLIDAIYESVDKFRDGKTFADVANLGGGGTPSTKDESFWNGTLRWATPTDITGLDGPWLFDTGRQISAEGLESITSKMYPRRTILMTSRASIGHYALANGPTAVNQGFIAIEAKDKKLQSWLFAQVRNRTDEFIAWANGATFLELSRGVFKKLLVDMPDLEDLDSFTAKVDPILDRMESLQIENRALAATRDELLPLLMSGKISVKDAEGRIDDATALKDS